MEWHLYTKWLAILCVVLAVFGISVMLVGYKDPSIGRVATVVALGVAAAVLGYKAYKG